MSWSTADAFVAGYFGDSLAHVSRLTQLSLFECWASGAWYVEDTPRVACRLASCRRGGKWGSCIVSSGRL
jgi:hypothetical protein